MQNVDREKRASLAVWLLLAIVSYPLSMGPLCWLDARGLLPEARTFQDALEIYCMPLQWAYDHSDTCAWIFDWYSMLWD